LVNTRTEDIRTTILDNEGTILQYGGHRQPQGKTGVNLTKKNITIEKDEIKPC
jgi:hypothetical protein